MKKLFLLSFSFLLGIGMPGRAQSPVITNCVNPANYLPGSDIGVASPQHWNLMKYGGSTPHLYTGTVSLSIPVYMYQDMDFTVPISLNYASNGYVPNVQAGEVGLNWYLDAGGCITREVRGIPDEYSSENISGYLWFKGEDYSNTNYDLATGERNADGMYIHNAGRYKVETDPDIYTFNFMGHTGSFTLAGKKVYVFAANHPHGEYVVEMSTGGGSIAITTGDGYKYRFTAGERERKTIEIYEKGSSGHLTFSDQIYSTWMLSEIVASNGRTVTFEYERDYFEQARPGGKDERVAPEITETGGYRALSELYMMKYSQSIFQLKKIIIDRKVEVGFVYGDKQYKETSFIHGDRFVDLKNVKKLESITVTGKNPEGTTSTLKTCTFDYAYSSAGERQSNKVMFLRSVNLSGEGTYRMEYHREKAVYPYHGTVSYDEWGYYNRKPSYNLNEMYPEMERNTSNFAESMSLTVFRLSDFNYAVQGVLAKITYPTGGYTTFEYDNMVYHSYLTRDQSSANMPYVKETMIGHVAGGARIRKITDYASDNTSRSRTYEYGMKGILEVTPRYYYEEYRYDRASRAFKEAVWNIDCTDVNAYHTNEPHVTYSCVEEVFDDGSRIAYNFATYRDCPDLYKSRKATVAAPDYFVAQADLHNNFLWEPDYAPQFRGTLLSKIWYDNAGRREKEITWDYNTTYPAQRRYVESVKKAADLYYIQRTFLESFPLIGVSQTEYPDHGNPVATRVSYDYNSKGQVIKQTRFCSDGSKESIYTKYVNDIWVSLESDYYKMIQQNVVNLPLSTQKTLACSTGGGTYGPEETVSSTTTTYKPVHTCVFRPSAVSRYTMGSQVLHESYIYDWKGRLSEKTDSRGLQTTYVWGWEYRSPLAEVVGASNATVRAAIGSLELSGDVALPEGKEAALRSLPGVQVTTYKYAPYIGITQITDPTGRKRTFTYTPSGKLAAEYNDRGDCIQRFLYSNDNN